MLRLQDNASVILDAVQGGKLDALKHVVTIQNPKGLLPNRKRRSEGEMDREELSQVFWKLAIALADDPEECCSLDPVSDLFEYWEGYSEAYFEAHLPNLSPLNFDLCVTDGKVFVKVEH